MEDEKVLNLFYEFHNERIQRFRTKENESCFCFLWAELQWKEQLVQIIDTFLDKKSWCPLNLTLNAFNTSKEISLTSTELRRLNDISKSWMNETKVIIITARGFTFLMRLFYIFIFIFPHPQETNSVFFGQIPQEESGGGELFYDLDELSSKLNNINHVWVNVLQTRQKNHQFLFNQTDCFSSYKDEMTDGIQNI